MQASETCAAINSNRLLLWKTEQTKGLILEGEGGDYDDDDDATMTMTRRTLKGLGKVCHAG
jgi:hypothetical protein